MINICVQNMIELSVYLYAHTCMEKNAGEKIFPLLSFLSKKWSSVSGLYLYISWLDWLSKCPLTSQNSMKAWVYRELYIYGVYLHILRWNGRHYTVAIDNMQVREREFLFCMDLWFYL